MFCCGRPRAAVSQEWNGTVLQSTLTQFADAASRQAIPPLLLCSFCISAWPSSLPLWWNKEIKSYFRVLKTWVRAGFLICFHDILVEKQIAKPRKREDFPGHPWRSLSSWSTQGMGRRMEVALEHRDSEHMTQARSGFNRGMVMHKQQDGSHQHNISC